LALIFSIASFALSVFAFLFFKNYLKRRTGSERILTEFRDEIDAMITELNEATVRDETLVEARVKTLRALLEDTNRRIGTFTRELGRRDRETAALNEYNRGAPKENAGHYTELGNRLKSPFTLIEPAATEGGAEKAGGEELYLPPELFGGKGQPASPEESVQKSAQVSGAPDVPDLPARLSPEPSYPIIQRAARQISPKPKPFAEQVMELHRAGFSSNLIASKLGAAITEVELAIAMSKRQ
jgi:hypothetical protein